MKTILEKRKDILAKIDKMSDEKLDELLKVSNSVELGQTSLQDTISMMGSWTEIDDEIILDFKERWSQKRETNSRKSRWMMFF